MHFYKHLRKYFSEFTFKRPEPPSKWEGVLQTVEQKPGCFVHVTMDPGSSNVSEDCLYMNIIRPHGTTVRVELEKKTVASQIAQKSDGECNGIKEK